MVLHRCDVCKRAISHDKGDHLEISWSWTPGLEICRSCADPVIRTLTDQELLPKKLLKNLRLTNS